MQVYKHRKTTAIVIDTVAKRRRDLLALLVITKFSMTVFHFSLRFSPLGVQEIKYIKHSFLSAEYNDNAELSNEINYLCKIFCPEH